MKSICIIPARGGSKRIPRKNIKLFLGKPIIAYSIETALRTGLFEKVIVSTDDQEIKAISEYYGAEVPFLRPQNLSDDYATTIEVVRHSIIELEKLGFSSQFHCVLYPTAPMVTVEELLLSRDFMEKDLCDFSFVVGKFNPNPLRAFRIDGFTVQMIDSTNYPGRTQDLNEFFFDAGQFYFGTRKRWFDDSNIFSGKNGVIYAEKMRAIDIDTEEDWNLVEIIVSHRLNHS